MIRRYVFLNHVPGHEWVRFFVGGRKLQPGHRWMYMGIIRRDAWRIGPVGFGVMRMPKPCPDHKPEEG